MKETDALHDTPLTPGPSTAPGEPPSAPRLTTTSGAPDAPPRSLIAAAFTAFAAFGSFWGVWGASVPRVQAQADVSDGQLGVALLFVGGGALPAMLLVGRALDRWGLRLSALLIVALGSAGTVMVLTAWTPARLCAGLAVVGACGGAADVSMNAIAGRAERLAGRPVITRAHGVFSALVVLAGLAAGAAAAASLPVVVPFAAVAALCVVAGAFMLKALPRHVTVRPEGRSQTEIGTARPWLGPLLLIGVLGMLAFASENAHQSWSAVFLHEDLHAGTGLAAVGPAVFAGTVAITRFGIGSLKSVHPLIVIQGGAFAAAAGTGVIAIAPTLGIAVAGLVLTGAGTAVLFPTLLGSVSHDVEGSRRGRATSVVTTTSYLGFLLGPVYVGFWADSTGLRGAMTAVAALTAILFVLTPAMLRISRHRTASARR